MGHEADHGIVKGDPGWLFARYLMSEWRRGVGGGERKGESHKNEGFHNTVSEVDSVHLRGDGLQSESQGYWGA